MKPKKTYTNWTGRRMELVECAIGNTCPGPLHTYPLDSGESVELAPREGVRLRWRKYMPEGLK